MYKSTKVGIFCATKSTAKSRNRSGRHTERTVTYDATEMRLVEVKLRFTSESAHHGRRFLLGFTKIAAKIVYCLLLLIMFTRE